MNLIEGDEATRHQLANVTEERDHLDRMFYAHREAAAAIDASLAEQASGALLSPCAWIKTATGGDPIRWRCSNCLQTYETKPEHGFCDSSTTCAAAIRAKVARDAWKARELVIERMNARSEARQ